MFHRFTVSVVCAASLLAASFAGEPSAGFTKLFNGQDMTGWHGWAIHSKGGTPAELAKDSPAVVKEKISKWTEDAKKHWTVKDGELINDGYGAYLATEKEFSDYELHIEYKTVPKADSGIYLKTVPQVQIWDSTEEAKFKLGANKGSGGLWNNSPGAPGKDPLVLADKPFGEWNKFRIIQLGSRTTIYLNDKLVVDHAILENYWDRKLPVPKKGKIVLQTHGGEIRWRNIFLKEFTSEEANKILAAKIGDGFQSIFNGKDFDGWQGALDNYEVVDGAIRCKKGKGGVLYTKKEYADFQVALEIKLPKNGNNGLNIRYPGGNGDGAYIGMTELQVLDDDYKGIDPRQAHGSAYGMVAAVRGFQRPIGEWNFQLVTVKGSTIQVELNGNIILNTDLSKVTEYMGNRPHPGKDRTSGFFGFAGHSDPVEFRHVQIKELK